MAPMRAPQRGFTIVELAVTMAVFALLVTLAASNLSSWMQNTRVRTTADYIQDGIRLAQAEAVKQNRVVAFIVTNVAPTVGVFPAPAAAGAPVNYWYAATVPWTAAQLNSGGVATASNVMGLVASGNLNSDASQVTITGSVATLCFSPYGRLTGLSADPTGTVVCGVPVNAPPTASYNIAPTIASANSHPLRVNVTLGGQVRMCDPAKLLANGYPDGC